MSDVGQSLADASGTAGARPGHPCPGRARAGQVLVVVLNFNGLEDTLACLASLRAQTTRDMAVLVIDNGSSDDDLGRIASGHPWAELIALPANLGWAGGNNIGMTLARRRGFGLVCLLNNDTVLDADAIEAMLTATATIREPCLLHPTIAYFDDPTVWQINPAQPAHTSGAARDVVELSGAYGACLMMQAGIIDQVGLLDERFFLQLEETDYFQRARKLGIRSFCARRARVLHRESASFGGRSTETKTYYQVRNGLLLAEKHAPGPLTFLRAVRALLWMLHHQSGVAGWRDLAGWAVSKDALARAARQGAGDYLRRRFGERRIAGTAPLIPKRPSGPAPPGGAPGRG